VPEDETDAAELIDEFEVKYGAQQKGSVQGARIAKKTHTKLRKDGKDTKKRRPGRPRKSELAH
jgi:hypothetical protein